MNNSPLAANGCWRPIPSLLRRVALLMLGLWLGGGGAGAADGPVLSLSRGDHLAVIGNTLADRMQHSGHFETLVVARHPEHDLVFRNLAVSGDELVTRHRSENFGSPDDWLKKVRADVVLGFFGFNESFRGAEGLDDFKSDLERFIEHLRAQDFSGRGTPRLVLFSPLAAERHQDPNFPDPAPLNHNLALYTAAMAGVAQAKGVPFIDLFNPSQRLYAEAASSSLSLTVNGLHLTEAGDARLAPVMFRALFGEEAPGGDLAKLRDAINQKNWEWHQRYRTVDGYNVYGGRSQLSFESGPGGSKLSNYHVMQEEMTQRDTLTANRDRRVWAVARGADLPLDDSNLPPTTPVTSNKPGPNPDRTHAFLSGEEAMAKMTVHSGMKLNLFAAESEFPDLINPVQMAWDLRGRLWVAVWPNYPSRRPDSPKGDSLLVFEDTNGDGRADRCTPFLDDLNAPTGFQVYKDGVLVVQAPDVWWVRDTDGDGRGDWKQRVLMGLDSADSHHTANALCLDPAGAVYLSDGVFHRTQIETPEGPVRNNDAAIYRFVPRTGEFETYIPYGFANPHGRVFDRWGNDLVTDATGNESFFGPAFSGRLDYPAKHPGMRQFWARPSRPCAGTGLLSSRHFPDEFQGDFLNCNVIGFQGIYRVKVSEDGSGLKGETMEPLVHSSDPNFRPVAVNCGPDGALYFLDWHNPIIGHMQHHLRDPNRDDAHGRIYRVTHEGRPLLKPTPIAGQPIPALLELLKEPENLTRELAKIELDTRDTAEVIAATKRWAAALDPAAPDHPHQLAEALWVHQWHNVVDRELLDRLLRSSDHRARAAATRVLCYWRDRVPGVLALLRIQAEDPHPRVRLEAIRAASFFRQAEAAEVALAVLKQPTDYYLDYTLTETLRQLEPYWRRAIAEGRAFATDNPAGVNHLVARATTAELLNLPPTDLVQTAILGRAEIPDATRNAALVALAERQSDTPAVALLGLLEQTHGVTPESAATRARLLPLQPTADLRPVRDRLIALAQAGGAPAIRPAVWAALVVADEAPEPAWKLAVAQPASLADFLTGLPMLYDSDLRDAAYERVLPLVAETPHSNSPTSPPAARLVRVELPRTGTLTLAEVEVFGEGRNLAPTGKARQSSTASGGDAARAIDGRKDGSYDSGAQTHTRENEVNPWWELDLVTPRTVEAVTVWNRTDGDLGQRLDGFNLVVLDDQRRELFRRNAVPAPAPSVQLAVT
ncbi:MAG: PVC-type heme-binding CxxCH protein, partial [Limisphaerales bacterium]